MIKSQNVESKELGPSLEDNEISCRSKKKGRLVGRKEKLNLQLFGFAGKARDEIDHFNIIKPKEIYCPCRKLQNLYGEIVPLFSDKTVFLLEAIFI